MNKPVLTILSALTGAAIGAGTVGKVTGRDIAKAKAIHRDNIYIRINGISIFINTICNRDICIFQFFDQSHSCITHTIYGNLFVTILFAGMQSRAIIF